MEKADRLGNFLVLADVVFMNNSLGEVDPTVLLCQFLVSSFYLFDLNLLFLKKCRIFKVNHGILSKLVWLTNNFFLKSIFSLYFRKCDHLHTVESAYWDHGFMYVSIINFLKIFQSLFGIERVFKYCFHLVTVIRFSSAQTDRIKQCLLYTEI